MKLSKRKQEDHQEFELRRLKRNMREQKRSLELSMQIQCLGDLLTGLGSSAKSDKFSVLSGTLQLINSLEQQCRQSKVIGSEGKAMLTDNGMKALLSNLPLPWALVNINGSISQFSYGFGQFFNISNSEDVKMSIFDLIEPSYVTNTYSAMMGWKNQESLPGPAEIRALVKMSPQPSAIPNSGRTSASMSASSSLSLPSSATSDAFVLKPLEINPEHICGKDELTSKMIAEMDQKRGKQYLATEDLSSNDENSVSSDDLENDKCHGEDDDSNSSVNSDIEEDADYDDDDDDDESREEDVKEPALKISNIGTKNNEQLHQQSSQMSSDLRSINRGVNQEASVDQRIVNSTRFNGDLDGKFNSETSASFSSLSQPKHLTVRKGRHEIVLTPIISDKAGSEVSFHLKIEVYNERRNVAGNSNKCVTSNIHQTNNLPSKAPVSTMPSIANLTNIALVGQPSVYNGSDIQPAVFNPLRQGNIAPVADMLGSAMHAAQRANVAGQLHNQYMHQLARAHAQAAMNQSISVSRNLEAESIAQLAALKYQSTNMGIMQQQANMQANLSNPNLQLSVMNGQPTFSMLPITSLVPPRLPTPYRGSVYPTMLQRPMTQHAFDNHLDAMNASGHQQMNMGGYVDPSAYQAARRLPQQYMSFEELSNLGSSAADSSANHSYQNYLASLGSSNRHNNSGPYT